MFTERIVLSTSIDGILSGLLYVFKIQSWKHHQGIYFCICLVLNWTCRLSLSTIHKIAADVSSAWKFESNGVCVTYMQLFFHCAASTLNGPVEVVTAYTGRGLLLFLRGLDKFLTLYDGLVELKPLETVFSNSLPFQILGFWITFCITGFKDIPQFLTEPVEQTTVFDAYDCSSFCTARFDVIKGYILGFPCFLNRNKFQVFSSCLPPT